MTKERKLNSSETKQAFEGLGISLALTMTKREGNGEKSTSHYLHLPFYAHKAKNRHHWVSARAPLLCKMELLGWDLGSISFLAP